MQEYNLIGAINSSSLEDSIFVKKKSVFSTPPQEKNKGNFSGGRIIALSPKHMLHKDTVPEVIS